MPDVKICGKCNAKNPASNSFCEQCGSKLNVSAPVPPSPDRIEKIEKKQTPVTVKPAKSVASNEPEAKERIQASFPALPSSGGISLSWMNLIYIALFLITVFTRFDHLGDKPHHHDESMHSFYSYQLFKDGDYEYNPMMHGPFQFHGNAFMYYLFGVSDATSRYLAAFFGIFTVVLAMFLSPFFGRTGAFLATLLIVISPSFMYFDRFTREDAYICGATFAMVVFLFRYLRSRQPVDLWIASLGFIIAFCTKESMFITIAVIGTYLFIRLLPWLDVFIAGGLTCLGILSQIVLKNIAPEMPQSTRLVFLLVLAGAAFGWTLYNLFLHWKSNMGKNVENSLWSAIAGLRIEKVQIELMLFVGWWILCLLILRVPFLHLNQPTFISVLMLLAYFAIVGRFAWLWLSNISTALTGSITIISVVFTLLFTTFFTVGATQPDWISRLHYLLNALYQGAFGGLEYWWGQHDVHRGDEPFYYYLVELPANELVSFLFSIVAIVYYGLIKRKNMPLFLAYWYVGSLGMFSWAGEKMPWLIIHPLLPALLLTAYFVGDIWDSSPLQQGWRAARVAALIGFGILASYSLHSAVLLSFYHEANPVEPLVYVQSGPDCNEVERIIRQISYGETGGPDLPLTIEDKCSWPFAWQLRDFEKRNHPSTITQADNPIILTGTEADNQSYPILSQAGYVNRKYKLRVWWVPSWFKKGFPGSEMNFQLFTDWLFSNFIPLHPARPDMVDWTDLKNWVLYRQVWSDMGSYNMRMWVRPDLAQKYGFTETTRSDVPVDYPKPDAVPTPAPTPVTGKKSRSKGGK